MPNYAQRFFWVIILLVVWTLVWKGLALWKSARRGDKAWFIALLIVNTVGALEILYLLVFSADRPAPPTQPAPPKT